MPELTLRIERIEDVWEEGLPLMLAEHEELEVKRPFAPDIESLKKSETAGIFKVLVAREDGGMVGYLSWMVDFDVESYGTLIAHQAAWYVLPDRAGVAARMFDWALDYWKSIGVKFVYLHHTNKGRGARLGAFFERRGAHLHSFTYELDLEK